MANWNELLIQLDEWKGYARRLEAKATQVDKAREEARKARIQYVNACAVIDGLHQDIDALRAEVAKLKSQLAE